MIATIAVIAATAEKKKFSKPLSRIAATTITEIVVAAIAGEWFHMIAMIAAIAEVFFSQRSQRWSGSYGNRVLI